jgi:hypothetical protein
MRLKIIVTALVGFALAGCVSSSLPKTAPTTLDDGMKKTVQTAVTATLKDPNSAMFGAMQAGLRPDGIILVCGYVNAKNSFGGYTGNKLFEGLLYIRPQGNAFIVTGMGGTSDEDFAVGVVCRSSGLQI